jgi:HD-like signal output (HDOD) protein
MMLTPEEIITGNTELASPPDIYQKITSTLDDPTKGALDLAKIIDLDAGLATRILRLVNSAFYSFSANITSISHAVSIIGATELRSLVLTTVVVERFSQLPNGLIPMNKFWEISVKCALYSRSLGQHHKNYAGMDSLFICGLLHRIGLIIIYSKLPELARSAILLSDEELLSEAEAQDELLGFNYADVGATLAKQWELPQVIQVTLQNHLNPEPNQPYSVESGVICLARELSEIDTSDQEAVSKLLEPNNPLWEITGLKSELLGIVLPEVDELFSETYRMIYQT